MQTRKSGQKKLDAKKILSAAVRLVLYLHEYRLNIRVAVIITHSNNRKFFSWNGEAPMKFNLLIEQSL